MRFLAMPCLVLVCLLSVPAAHAQVPQGGSGDGDGYGGGMGGGGMHRNGGMMGGRWGGRMEFPSKEDVEGPPTPAALRDLVGLDGAGSARYTSRYTSHMDTTSAARDSLRTVMRGLRDARDAGDREAMRAGFHERAPLVSRLWKDLSKRDQSFVKEAKKSLTKDQRAKFEQWQDEQAKEKEEQQRERHAFGGPSGPEDSRPDPARDAS
jgi:hypothetical protein